jgi:two-component system response regulator WspF
MAVEALRRVVAGVPHLDLAWIALDGAEAVRKCSEDVPDVILMDLIMPVMDGVEATRRIMESSPCAILVVTASVGRNAAKVYEAMSYGALDATRTPTLDSKGISESHRALLEKIASIGQLLGLCPVAPPPGAGVEERPRVSRDAFPRLLAIGASTGGPRALERILSGLDRDFPGAIVLVQHIDAEFAAGLAEWLERSTSWNVGTIRDRETPREGKVYLAGSNHHLILNRHLELEYTSEPESLVYRPSVDVFFRSVATRPSGSVIGVLLTGMGRDGAEGLLALRRAGHPTIAQDEASSVVYGMPKAAAELGAADSILPIEKIAETIGELSKRAAP